MEGANEIISQLNKMTPNEILQVLLAYKDEVTYQIDIMLQLKTGVINCLYNQEALRALRTELLTQRELLNNLHHLGQLMFANIDERIANEIGIL